VRWFPFIKELDRLNSMTFELMPTESGSVGKKGRCTSPMKNLVLYGTGSSYVVPAVLSYFYSNGETNVSEP